MSERAKFGVGQLIHHRLFDYRGVIFDVDATFQGSDAWYRQMARTTPPRDKPWYHVLVDGANHTAYVAERNLEPDTQQEEISHPLLGQLFGGFEDGYYLPGLGVN